MIAWVKKISNDIISNCDQCGGPCDDYTNCNYVDCNLLLYNVKNVQESMRAVAIKIVKKCLSFPMMNKKIKKSPKKPSLSSFKKSVRPQENIAERKYKHSIIIIFTYNK